MFQASDIILFIVLGLIIYFWWYTQGLRQIALSTCKAHCNQQDLQLLDQTVALSRLWLKRDDQGRWQWHSKFVFEFTISGADRYKGRLELLGKYAQTISLGPYRKQPNNTDHSL